MERGKKWVLLKHFEGLPKRSDLEIQEFDIPEVHDGEVLLAAEVLTVDPYMRLWSDRLNIGDTIMGEMVGRVEVSKDPAIKIGEYRQIFAGWVTHAVVKGETTTLIPKLPEDAPLSLAIGTLGMTGMTAYFGLLDVAELKSTDVVLINAAAGAVGSVAGQIAKIKGCRVIGSTGSDEKVKFLKEELGFDEAYNYKVVTPDKLNVELKKLAPDGIDVFFENVGGEASSIIYGHLRMNARVAVSGAISTYNSGAADKPKVTEFTHLLMYNFVTIRGFLVTGYLDKRDEALKEMAEWIKEGKLKYLEHKFKGFEKMYDAFLDLLSGANVGKVVVTI